MHCKKTDRTSENTTPVIFWFVARSRLSNEHLNNGCGNREGRAKTKDIHRKNEHNLKIQFKWETGGRVKKNSVVEAVDKNTDGEI